MTYGNGNSQLWPFSQAPDVVAHELTHGVTQFSSRLIYSNESGALNEAMSDIFGALVDRQVGAEGMNVWLVGEGIVKGDGAIRDMSNPARKGHYDYYPLRYQGEQNNGGVHWNSGIVNLAFKLMVTGGTHPRGFSRVNVTGLVNIFQDDEDLAFIVAGEIFYCANSKCLTRHSTFLDALHCTAVICGSMDLPEDALVVQTIYQAWAAVGVMEDMIVPAESPTDSPTMEFDGESATGPPSTLFPSAARTFEPPALVTKEPSVSPSIDPTASSFPSIYPTSEPSGSFYPSLSPTGAPSWVSPTLVPTTLSPTAIDSSQISLGSNSFEGNSTSWHWLGVFLGGLVSLTIGLAYMFLRYIRHRQDIGEKDTVVDSFI